MTHLEPLLLSEARRRLLEASRMQAVRCPCCSQLAKVYRRKITSSMARWLIELVRRHRRSGGYFSISEPWSLAISKGTGDIAKLRHWNLIEQEQRKAHEGYKRTSGRWRPTDLGIAFVDGTRDVPRDALLYDSKLECLDGPMIGIRHALGDRFDYEELMRASAEDVA